MFLTHIYATIFTTSTHFGGDFGGDFSGIFCFFNAFCGIIPFLISCCFYEIYEAKQLKRFRRSENLPGSVKASWFLCIIFFVPRRGIFNREESGITESYCRNPRWVSLSFIRNSAALFYRNFRASYRKIPRPYKYRSPFRGRYKIRGRYKTPCLPSACNPPQASFPRSAYRMNSHIPNFHNLFVGITSSFSVVFPSVSKTRKNGRRHFVCARLSIAIRYPRIRFCRESPQRGNFR